MNRNENIAFIVIHTPGTPEQQAQVKAKLEQLHDYKLREMVADIQTKLANEFSRMAHLKYYLVQNGLDVDKSWPLVEAKLGPFFTIEDFVKAYGQDAQFRETLTWRSEPLALYHKQHAAKAEAEAAEQGNQRERDQKERAIFSSCVHALLRHGINIQNTDAHFEATRSHLHFDLGLDFTVENVLAVLKDGNAQGTEKYGTLNLSPNDPATVRATDQADGDSIYQSIKPRLAYRQDLIGKAKEKIAQ